MKKSLPSDVPLLKNQTTRPMVTPFFSACSCDLTHVFKTLFGVLESVRNFFRVSQMDSFDSLKSIFLHTISAELLQKIEVQKIHYKK